MPPDLANGTILLATSGFDGSDTGAPVPIRPGDVMAIIGATSHFGLLSYWIQVSRASDPSAAPTILLADARILEARSIVRTAACPGDTPTLPAVLALVPAERLACFGSRPITIGPVQVRTADMPERTALVLSADGRTSASRTLAVGGERFVTLAPSDQWVYVSGRFDDPEGVRCPAADVTITITCREAFVATLALGALPPDGTITGAWRPLPARHSSADGLVALVWAGGRLVRIGTAASVPGRIARVVAEVFDPVSRTWSNAIVGPLDDLTGSAVAVLGGLVVIAGGSTSGEGGIGTATGASFDPIALRWRSIARAPFPIDGSSRTASNRRTMVVAVALASDGPGAGSPIRMATYDATTDRWRVLPTIDSAPNRGWQVALEGGRPIVAIEPLDRPTEVWALGPADRWLMGPSPGNVSVDSPTWTGSELLAIGRPADDSLATVIEVHDPTTDRWRPIADLPDRTLDAGSMTWTGRVAVVGVDAQYALDPMVGQWQLVQPMPFTTRPTGLIAWSGDRLFAAAESADPSAAGPHETIDEFVPDLPRVLSGP